MLWAHLRNSPPSLLIIGNNYLKQLGFGARANSPVPDATSSLRAGRPPPRMGGTPATPNGRDARHPDKGREAACEEFRVIREDLCANFTVWGAG